MFLLFCLCLFVVVVVVVPCVLSIALRYKVCAVVTCNHSLSVDLRSASGWGDELLMHGAPLIACL